MEKSEIWEGNKSIAERLKKIPALREFDEEELRELLQTSEIHKYSAGETIIEEGTLHKGIYYLISGKVKISKKGKKLLVLHRGGDVFGEMSALGSGHTTASVTAINNTVCLVVSIAALDEALASSRFVFRYLLYREFAEALAHRLRFTTKELIRTQEQLERMEAAYELELGVKRAELEEQLATLRAPQKPGGTM